MVSGSDQGCLVVCASIQKFSTLLVCQQSLVLLSAAIILPQPTVALQGHDLKQTQSFWHESDFAYLSGAPRGFIKLLQVVRLQLYTCKQTLTCRLCSLMIIHFQMIQWGFKWIISLQSSLILQIIGKLQNLHIVRKNTIFFGQLMRNLEKIFTCLICICKSVFTFFHLRGHSAF